MNWNRRGLPWLLTMTLLLVGIGLVAGQTAADELLPNDQLSALAETMALVQTQHYYQQVGTIDLLEAYASQGTINGMLQKALDDPYTRYLDAHALERLIASSRGTFGGIGILVGIRDDQLQIISPIRGTPGEQAGLLGGDLIRAIDGYSTTYMSLDEAVGLMRGPIGEQVVLTIERGDKLLEVEIVRAQINVEAVAEAALLESGIGYVELVDFNNNTLSELQQALDELDDQGMQALILDLRFNPGGTLDAAYEVGNLFVSSGPIYYLEDAAGERSPVNARARGTRDPLPMVVLVNGSSASASEIVAGALRDHDLATLLGSPTFGKGAVQTMYSLSAGGGLSITEQVYQTPGGHHIDQVGLTPDVLVELTEEEEDALYLDENEVEDQQLQAAVELLQEMLEEASARHALAQ